MLNVELFHQLVGTILTLFVGQVVTNLQDRHQVVVNAETTENGGFLRQIADPATRARVQRQKTDVFIVNDNVAGIARHNTHDHVEGGRFTRTVRAKQPHDFAGVDGQTDIFYDTAALVGLREVFCS